MKTLRGKINLLDTDPFAEAGLVNIHVLVSAIDVEPEQLTEWLGADVALVVCVERNSSVKLTVKGGDDG